MVLMEDRERKERAAARRSWPIRVYRLGEEPDDDLSATTTAAERLAMMWPLAVDAWTLSGQGIPDYPRNEMPVRVIRASDRRAKGGLG
ncbi:MAG TPA: hypothetical protein VHC97_17580 [Thermoanaerobaculia bacterium]|jgi:hypothetical protein|nr:hypothetical protein [Thermoanaerobaculia bacterium]